MSKTSQDKSRTRSRRRSRIRARIFGTADRPRISVRRTLAHIEAQLIDDASGKTLAHASTRKLKSPTTIESAKQVGSQLAELASKLNIKEAVFDRGGYKYHGQVKAVAEAAREAGLKF